MLKLIDVKKDYYVGEQTIPALKGVSIDFRKNEFVAILGQSGCGKTTLMNIIGGLDRATSGNIVLDGQSTAGFKETDWDDYRNSKIGFVFQSYNLISHLNVLTNVELALTISGVTGEARAERAKRALDRVGLEGQYHKKPNQLSGGQMQRVAIARAIVNEPDILLADEPTGAIDSETSVQIMDILKEIAGDKLVIMVTHNADLADEYATRIVRILDGEIIADSNPYVEGETVQKPENDVEKQSSDLSEAEGLSPVAEAPQEDATATEKAVKVRKRKHKGVTMSFWTSIKLSFRNLVNKRGRSILTSVAGSIGIISIALILAVNNGFNVYIDNFEKQSMSKYPITVSSGEFSVVSMFEDFLGGDDLDGDSMDIGSILDIFSGDGIDREKYTDEELIYIYGQFSGMFEAMTNSISKDTDISRFKKHLEENFDYSLGTVKYDYSVSMNIYKTGFDEGEYRQINPLSDSDTMAPLLSIIGGEDKDKDASAGIASALNKFAFWDELVADEDTINQQYSVLAGHLPENMNEIVLVLDEYNQISDFNMFALDELEVIDLLAAMSDTSTLSQFDTEFDEVMGKEYYVLPTSASYVYNEGTGLYDSVKTTGGTVLANAIETNAIKVKIAGIVRPKEGVDGGCIKGVVGYSTALGDYIINDANGCAYVAAQKAAYAAYTATLAAALPVQQKLAEGVKTSTLTPEEKGLLAAAAAAKLTNVSTGEELPVANYEPLLSSLNVRDKDKPSYIYIYPSAIHNKNAITAFIDEFNTARSAEEEAADAEALENGTPKSTTTYVVDYSDNLDSIVNELNGLVKTITYILIAVALVSVLVTMMLIAIIMYISVQDRTREIGILRSLGARKLDISNIFNVETMLLGLASGIIGVLLTLVLQFPANAIFAATLGIKSLLKIAWWHPIVLVAGAIVITVISGLVPAFLAAKKDPVNALRAE